MQPSANHPPRRSFIKQLALFLGGAAILGQPGGKSAADPAPDPVPRLPGGYRLTSHIRKYYETAAK